MTVTLDATSGTTCTITERTPSSVCPFVLPMSKPDLIDALKTFCADAESKFETFGSINFERRRDGIMLHVGSGQFLIRYPHVLELILEA